MLEVILAPVREHSRKPDEFYRRVERYCDGPFADLFARERRPGWDAWGDQIDLFSGNSASGPAGRSTPSPEIHSE